MADRDPAQWRDEEQLPLSELTEAMAVYSADGQVDDATGGDAGAEETFGDGPVVRPVADDSATDRSSQSGSESGSDPDPDSIAGRALRPSPEGRSGPV